MTRTLHSQQLPESRNGTQERELFWELSLPQIKKKKLCAGLTRESWVEIKFKKQQKSSTEQKKAVKETDDIRELADDTSSDERMDGWAAP